MIKKEYFPSQEVPDWIKERVMQTISIGPKRFRLMSLIRYRFLIPIGMFLVFVIGGYLYISPTKNLFVGLSTLSDTQSSGYSLGIASDTTILQQKLTEAENILNTISLSVDQEEIITL